MNLEWGDRVYTRDFTLSSQKWMEGTVTEVTGPLSYKIKLNDGSVIRRHVDSLKSRTVETETSSLDDFEGPICEGDQHPSLFPQLLLLLGWLLMDQLSFY